MSHFAGTASSYAEFRPRYPVAVWDTLADMARLDAMGRVLDLGAGPGTATLELARRAGSVVAVDLDPEMVAEGRRLTNEAGLTTVEWMTAGAEDTDFPAGSFRLIVIASAFHWMDRPLVASRCRSLLDDGGLLAVVNNPTPLMQLRDGSALGAAVRAVQDRWFSQDYYVLDVEALDPPETVLQQSGFRDVSVFYVPQVQEWTVNRFLGFLRSTSSRPDQRLGDRYDGFAAEIEQAIRTVEPSGRWTLEIPVQVIVGRP